MTEATRRAAIVGVGPGWSKSLAMWLAKSCWSVALLSRNEKQLAEFVTDLAKLQSDPDAKIVYREADASSPDALQAALDWARDSLGGILDVLNYNAARVADSKITDLTPSEFELYVRVSAVGTLVAGQWFTRNVRKDFIRRSQDQHTSGGEYPLLLITGGVLDKHPEPTLASLSAAKAASQTFNRLFAKTLPDECDILVCMPLITDRIMDAETGGFRPEFHPDRIIEKVFVPFFADRLNGKDGWVVERYL
ncbi:hypothetical protein LQW54_012894 [Pestalotiopsis sp. IQ-011]